MGSFISQEDHYTLGGLLGEGGQGAVHVLLLNGGPCGRAIKTIKIKKGFNKNLSREIEILGQVTHPNIVKCYSTGLWDKNTFGIVMELCDKSLQNDIEKLQRHQQYYLEFFVWILLSKISDGLSYLHYQKIIHRDIKPANILLLKGEPKISDFGLSKLITDSSLSMQTRCIGTEYFLAPESALSLSNPVFSEKSDVFALGKTFEYITSLSPSEYSQVLTDLIQKMMSINPEERPTAFEVLNIARNKLDAHHNATYNRFVSAATEYDEEKRRLEEQRKKVINMKARVEMLHDNLLSQQDLLQPK